MIRLVRKTLLWLSAANRDVLERCPSEQTRFVAAGGAVLTTTAMAALAGYFTAHALLHLGIVGSLLFGAGWALAIMNLERYVQSSIRRQRTWWLTLLMATPRVALAILLGFVISNPLLLKVFQAEVKAQVEVEKNAQLASARDSLKRQFASVPALQAQEKTLEHDLNTPFTVGTALNESPEYHSLARRYGIFRSEGAEGAADKTLAEMGPLRRKLLSQEALDNTTRHTEEREQLQATQRELEPQQAEFDGRNGGLKKAFHARGGLADQMRALGALVSSNSQVAFMKDVLMLFVLAIDMLPALLKTLLCMGRRSLYEQAEDAVEGSATSAVQAQETLVCREAQRAAEERLEMQAEVGQARLAKRIAMQKKMDEISIEILQETIRPHVENWARQTAERYAVQLKAEINRQRSAPRNRRHQDRTVRSQRRPRWPRRPDKGL
jgi:hypothetical protein